MKKIGQRVRSLREHKNWSQGDLADHSGLARSHISLIENNERLPGADTLFKLAPALQTTADYILGLTSDPTPRPVNQNHPALQDPDFREIMDLWPEFSVAIKQAAKNLLVHIASHKNAP